MVWKSLDDAKRAIPDAARTYLRYGSALVELEAFELVMIVRWSFVDTSDEQLHSCLATLTHLSKDRITITIDQAWYQAVQSGSHMCNHNLSTTRPFEPVHVLVLGICVQYIYRSLRAGVCRLSHRRSS